MKLEHIAVWTRDLERSKDFYVKYFNAVANDKYTSVHDFGEKFESYFLSFDGDCRLEIMQMARIPVGDAENGNETLGLTHFSFSMASRQELDALAERLQKDGCTLVGQPHTTGDGFYEACVLDPDGNRVEFAVVPE
ncbi:MAG: VOC family protein [Planctomycetaceae bacterium]|nr:VOC family protein [Planctomycetaceae bacterium]